MAPAGAFARLMVEPLAPLNVPPARLKTPLPPMVMPLPVLIVPPKKL